MLTSFVCEMPRVKTCWGIVSEVLWLLIFDVYGLELFPKVYRLLRSAYIAIWQGYDALIQGPDALGLIDV